MFTVGIYNDYSNPLILSQSVNILRYMSVSLEKQTNMSLEKNHKTLRWKERGTKMRAHVSKLFLTGSTVGAKRACGQSCAGYNGRSNLLLYWCAKHWPSHGKKYFFTKTGLKNSREGEPMVFSRYPVSMLFCPCYWKGFTQI